MGMNRNKIIQNARRRLSVIQNNICAYCKNEMINPSAEHVVPQSKGGRNWFNLVLTCEECNWRRDSNRLSDEQWLSARYIILRMIADDIAQRDRLVGKRWKLGIDSLNS